MRKTIFKSALAVTILMWFNIAIVKAQDTACLRIHDVEKDVLNIGGNGDDWHREYTTSNLRKGLSDFYKYFQYTVNNPDNPPTMLDSCNERVSLDDICELYSDIIGSKKYNPNTDFAAIRIIYGMEEKHLVMIYQPIILKYSDSNYEEFRIYNLDTSIQNFYRLTSDGILQRFENRDQIVPLVDAFRSSDSHIYITRRRGDEDHKYKDGPDAKSTVFLMQDIISVYLRNPNPPSATPKITFSFVSNAYRYSLFEKYKQKAHIVAHYNIGKNPRVDGLRFSSCGADYSQMCPPQCDAIWLQIAD